VLNKKEVIMGKKSLKNSLKDRIKTNHSIKDYGEFGKRILKVPEDTEFYVPEKGHNKIEILPYEVATKNHPKLDKGDLDYVLDVWVHKGIGPSEDNYVCLKKTFGKPCPVCEELALLKKSDDVDDEDLDALKPKRRVIYNLFDHNDEKVKVFEVSHFLFEKELLEEALVDSEEVTVFADPEEGSTIKFRAKEEEFGGRKYFKYKSFQFLERDEPIDDDVLEEAIALDSILIVPTYDEVKAALEGRVEDDDEDDEDEEDDAPKRTKTNKKSKRKIREEVDEDDDEEEEDEEEEETVRKKKKRKTEDDEESKKKKSSKKKANGCPHGYCFGKDNDEYDECIKCKKWEECAEAGEE
jgi:hypothetical protein